MLKDPEALASLYEGVGAGVSVLGVCFLGWSRRSPTIVKLVSAWGSILFVMFLKERGQPLRVPANRFKHREFTSEDYDTVLDLIRKDLPSFDFMTQEAQILYTRSYVKWDPARKKNRGFYVD